MKPETRIKRVCPKCHKEYTGVPAISRVDNCTPICPRCGTREALESMGIAEEEIEKMLKKIPSEDEILEALNK